MAGVALDTLQFTLSVPVSSGSTWSINSQPGWIATNLAAPVSGVFP